MPAPKPARPTPGPWHLASDYRVAAGDGPDEEDVATTAWFDRHHGSEVRKANAHLIAAAPDLLAACEMGLSALLAFVGNADGTEIEPEYREEFEALTAAIAKAKAGTP